MGGVKARMPKAVVLCGGLGTRLGELTRETPKPLLEVAGRPFLDHVLQPLAASGVEDVTLAASFHWQKIAAVYGDAWQGLRLRYSVESEPAGTGGAIRQAMREAAAQEALVLNGDTLLRMDFAALVGLHAGRHAQVTVAVRRVPDVSRYGAVKTAPDGRITHFGEKQGAGEGLINAGVYVVRAEVFDGIAAERFSFEHDVLAPGAQSLRLYAMQTDGLFIDIGTPEDLVRAGDLLR
jgi:D-glycero-alpha-D-manno-heptose 1-phosphate guanylyltransferase